MNTEPITDDEAVDKFAAMLKAKLAKARAKGRSGWRDPAWPAADINRQLHEHAAKGDPLDVAAYTMFLALRGEVTSAPQPTEPVALPPLPEPSGHTWGYDAHMNMTRSPNGHYTANDMHEYGKKCLAAADITPTDQGAIK